MDGLTAGWFRQVCMVYQAEVAEVGRVALAEVLEVPLLTGDSRLTGSTGPRCTIEIIKTSR